MDDKTLINGVEDRERLEILSGLSRIALFQFSEDLTINYVNSTWEKILHAEESDVLGSSWIDWIYKPDRKKFLKNWGMFLRGGKDFSEEIRVMTADGDIIWLKMCIYNLNCKVGEYVGTFIDNTLNRELLPEVCEIKREIQAMRKQRMG